MHPLDDAPEFDRGDNARYPFVCSYRFDGKTWTVTIYAATYEEAEMKLRAVGRGKVDGVWIDTIEDHQ